MNATVAKCYFVSGHLDLTDQEFEEHYVPRLKDAVNEGAVFCVGDARGCDAMTQSYLIERLQIHPLRLSVFHMFDGPRHYVGGRTYSGFKTDGERDRAMFNFSNDDIAWVRPGREKSGTARNLARRAGLHG